LEPLLNLCWRLLITLAICFWLQQPRSRAALALSCVLFLLSPLISATDDLYAMRQVLKESSPGKRTLKRAVNYSFAAGGSNTPPDELNSILQGLPCNQTCGCIVSAHPGVISPGRAPPFLFLAIASQTATLVCGAPSLSSHVILV
jgi:hypothetical protein